MAKAPVVEPKDLEHAVKVARVSSPTGLGLRNAALLYTLFGTGMYPAELGALRVADAVTSQGALKRKSLVRAEIAYNAYERPLYWVNEKLVAALNDYLDWRVENKVGLGTEGRFRGLDPHSFLFGVSDFRD